jgi:peptidoglycan/xylan/chitin deacetylase (PgdA/CDA1 family)
MAQIRRLAEYVLKLRMKNPYICCLLATVIISAGCSTLMKEGAVVSETTVTTWKDDKKGAISITYDDATINQFRQALPIMDSLGFKGTFFINTADIPDSRFAPKYLGRPLQQIISESNTPTTKENLFERCSALRFLDIGGAVEEHNHAGALYENNKLEEAFKVVDEAFAKARAKRSTKEVRPVLLTGDVITWPEIKRFASSGHEFGNHTISHPRLAVLDEKNLLYELEKCKEEILYQLGREHTFSAECPFGTENPRVMEYALKIHPALRNRMPEPYLEELNRWNQTAPGLSRKPYVQWQRGPLQKTTLEEMKSYVDTLLNYNKIWLVLTFHGIDGVGWEAKPHEELKAYFSYMKSHGDSLWVAPFGTVTKYIREKRNAKIDAVREGDKMYISLTHGLDSTYNYPLTLKTYLVPVPKEFTVSQNERSIAYTTGTDERGYYILYEMVPNKDDVVIQFE